MHDLSRRDVFKAATAAGAGAVVLPGITAASAPSAPAAADSTMSASEMSGSALSPPAQLTGRIVRPQDPDYASASLGWDELFIHYPLVIVFAQNTQDVVNALTWARQNNVALRVRSGRHSLEGWSNVDNGIVIDVSELKSITVDSTAGTATVGAGLNQLEAVTALGQKGLAVPTGTEGTVGLSGATLGGGFGLLTRYLGMACDKLSAVEIVVASGADGARAITVDMRNHPDLLWALRGAGNGNFGIVTSLTYEVAPLTTVVYVTASWDGLGDLQPIFDAWQSTAPFTDNRLTSQLEVHKNQILLFAVFAGGSKAQALKLLAPVLSIGNPSVAGQVGNWGEIYAAFQIPTALDPANWKFFSQFTSRPFPAKAISLIRSFMLDAPTDDSNFFTNAFGGEVRKSEPCGGAAFPHRGALFYSEPGAGWGTREDPKCDDPLTPVAQAWIAEFSQALRPYVDGAYVNVPNVGMQEWETAYWGPNYDRLRRIKAKYDPQNVFQYEQSIPPAFC
ncbi:MAG TPA: FAD-binding oxidoreductase [Trebonia sp.]|nr:FAD-binding oxidoreductase [Trebonia sp.]